MIDRGKVGFAYPSDGLSWVRVTGMYSCEPYIAHTTYGAIDGKANGPVISGQFYELGWDGTLRAGDITLSFDNDTKAFHVVMGDGQGNVTDEGEGDYLLSVRDKVQNAINALYE